MLEVLFAIGLGLSFILKGEAKENEIESQSETKSSPSWFNIVHPHNVECTHKICDSCNKKDRWGFCQEDETVNCIYLPNT